MKIQFWTTKDAILNKISFTLKKTQEELDVARKKLAELGEDDEKGFYNPEKSKTRKELKAQIGYLETDEGLLQDQIALITAGRNIIRADAEV